MPVYKVTLIFSSVGYGWTESYFLNLTAALSFQNLFTNYAQPLATVRLGLLGSNANITDIRMAIANQPFATLTQDDGRAGTYGAQGSIPNNALLVRCYPVNPGPAKSIFLRGIPASIIVNAVYAPNDTWNRAFAAYATFLNGAGLPFWGWYGVLSKVKTPITGYTITEGFQVVVTSSTPVFTVETPPKAISVRFTGINGKSELNGQQVVIAQSTTTVQTVDQFGVVPFTRGGFVTVQTKGFIPFGTVVDERVMTRKAGRPLFEEVGRARVRPKT